MDVKQDVCLIVCSTSNSIYGLSVKLPVQMARWSQTRCLSYCLLHVKFNLWSVCQAASSNGEMESNKMFVLLFAPRQIQFMVCLSSCQFKWRDECQSRCSSYCLLHVKFNLWSVCQAACSNGEMNVNKQDVRLIVCYLSNSIYGLSVKLPLQME